ncbi:MAG: RNA methyltransferase, partial [Cytophagales bacterium]
NSDFVPSHDLALSNIISKEIQSINVDLNSAIQYLKRNDISNILNEFVLRKSWFLVNFQEINIGFAKNIGNRINNYYPKELRILKDF